MSNAATAQVTVSGQVTRLFFSNTTFSAGVLRQEGLATDLRFAGPVAVNDGDIVKLTGTYENTKWGRQIKVTSLVFEQPSTVEGLTNYIANNPRISGIGPVRARKIAELFVERLSDVLTDDPEAIARACQVPLGAVLSLKDEWFRGRDTNAAATWLAQFGLTHHQVTTLLEKYGNSVVAIFQANPYRLIAEVKGYGFKRVDQIARKTGTAKDSPQRIAAGVLYCAQEELDAGHCWTDYQDLIALANRLLCLDDLNSRQVIEDALDTCIQERQLLSEPVDGRLLVALPGMRKMEQDLAEIFDHGRDPNPHRCKLLDDQCQVREGLKKGVPLTLNAGQQTAMLLALNHSVAVITGGAGSGKTFTLNTICRLYENAGLSMTLCAPTGKAAKRMEESTGRQASTIHRLLGYKGEDFEFEGKLPTDLLVVDETSMCDVPLFWHLLRAVDLSQTAVILVGDHNQLPPVGPGNALRDILASRLVPIASLTEIVRQAGELKRNSTAVLRGLVAPTSVGEPGTLRPWYQIAELGSPDDLLTVLDALYQETLADKFGLDLVGDVQVLTPTRKGPMGVDELNLRIQRIVQQKTFGVTPPTPPPAAKSRKPQFLTGDKVIHRKNNYSLEVMNGAVGRVKEVLPNGDMLVQYDDREVKYSKADGHVGELQLAYALTIHQTQGSEFPVAVVICHKAHSFQHHRNLLYTAVTRARRSAIILGDHWGIKNCATKVDINKRRTWLSLIPRRNE